MSVKKWSATLAGACVLSLSVAGAANAQLSRASVNNLEFGNEVGVAFLKRSSEGVLLSLRTSDLDADEAISLWWIIWDDPSACLSTPCNPGVTAPSTVMNATGGYADADGTGQFRAFLPVGFIHTNPASEVRQVFGAGLHKPWTSEIHAVLRSHGASTGSIEQISTLDGDCNPDCEDVQGAAFVVKRNPGNGKGPK